MFCFGRSAVSFGFPSLFLVFLNATFFDWKLLKIFWGTNLEPASFSKVFLIRLLKTILFSFWDSSSGGYFMVWASEFSSSALILLSSWLILLSFSWSMLWACWTFLINGAFFYFKKIGGSTNFSPWSSKFQTNIPYEPAVQSLPLW